MRQRKPAQDMEDKDDKKADSGNAGGSRVPDIVTLISSVAMGVVFGFALEKGAVYLPYIITRQMTFSQNHMLKMFLSAAATSALAQGVLSIVPYTASKVNALRTKKDCAKPGSRGTLAVFTGSSILGAGMAICGACPGTVIAQLGAGFAWYAVPSIKQPGTGLSALYVLAGGFCGVLAYTIALPSLTGFLQVGKVNECKLEKKAGIPFIAGTVALAALFGSIVFVADQLQPFTAAAEPGVSLLEQGSWHPALAGMCIGLLQVPGVFLLGKTIGSSSSYVVLLATALEFVTPSFVKSSSYLKSAISNGAKTYWQPLYLFGAFIGAAASAVMGGGHIPAPPDPSFAMVAPNAAASFAGGFLLLFGARLGGGCTSGLGLSDTGALLLDGFVGVCGMFGCGILTGVTLKMLQVPYYA